MFILPKNPSDDKSRGEFDSKDNIIIEDGDFYRTVNLRIYESNTEDEFLGMACSIIAWQQKLAALAKALRSDI